MNIRVRFPPSPTGKLHIGSLRSALYNYLYARHNNGEFIFRVEDTDQARKVEGAVEGAIKTLQRTGLEYDEGPILKDGRIEEKGKYGPYKQSERLEIYREHLRKLVKEGRAYRCDCSTERLDKLRKEQQSKKLPTGYDRHCRNKELSEKNTVTRFKMPREGETEFQDIIRGKIKFRNELLDDYVLMKSDGFPTYHLANVVDDHLMKITHVIRGEEWVPSTPKHVLLYQAFGWEVPEFAHLPLLLNEDRSKLSKRQGDVAVEDYLDKGYLPEALINFVALLGWNPSDSEEIYTLDELIKSFDLKKVNSAGAVFNREKLDWMNGKYIRSLTRDELVERSMPFLESAGVLKGVKISKKELGELLSLEQERVKTLAELPEAVSFLLVDDLEYEGSMLVWKKSDVSETRTRLNALLELTVEISEDNWNLKDIEDIVKKMIDDNEWGNGDTLWPLRVALSGRERSPGPFEIMTVLGKMKVIRRLEAARDLLK